MKFVLLQICIWGNNFKRRTKMPETRNKMLTEKETGVRRYSGAECVHCVLKNNINLLALCQLSINVRIKIRTTKNSNYFIYRRRELNLTTEIYKNKYSRNSNCSQGCLRVFPFLRPTCWARGDTVAPPLCAALPCARTPSGGRCGATDADWFHLELRGKPVPFHALGQF